MTDDADPGRRGWWRLRSRRWNSSAATTTPIVGQGRAYWQSVIDGDRTLIDAAGTFRFHENHWNPAVTNPAHHGYQTPSGVAHGGYRTRHWRR